MLTYLDALIEALVVRDTPEADRLLAHPLARILTADVRAEAEALRGGGSEALAPPLRLLQLRHQTAELLRDAPVVADRAEPPDTLDVLVAPRLQRSPPTARVPRAARMVQMELPLSA